MKHYFVTVGITGLPCLLNSTLYWYFCYQASTRRTHGYDMFFACVDKNYLAIAVVGQADRIVSPSGRLFSLGIFKN
jgi:hypothetical protein